jgi:hypothetical protein
MPRVIGSIKVRCHGFHRSKPIFEVLLGLGNGQTKQSTRDIKPPRTDLGQGSGNENRDRTPVRG